MNIYRRGSDETIVVATLKEFEYNGTYMGERKISATLKTPETIDFIVGDYVIFTIDNRQETFVLNKIPSVKKISSAGSIGNAFEYTLVFYGLQYELTTVQMRDITEKDDSIYTGMPNFSFYGNAEDLCSRISANLTERYYTIGNNGEKVGLWQFDLSESARDTDSYEISFSGENCFEALSNLNNEETFNLKFTIEGRTIKVGYKPKVISLASGTPFYFRYGKSSHKAIENGGGLYTIERIPEEKDIITRLRAYGGTQNVNMFYNRDDQGRYRYSPNIMLPEYNINGKDYIDADQDVIDYYGIREGSVTFEDIYPSIKGVKMGDFPDDIVTIEVSFEGGNVFLKLYKIGELGSKKEVNATTDLLVTVHNHSSKRAVVLIKKGQNKAICIDKDDNSIVFKYDDDFYFADVRVKSTNLHSDNGIYYIPYCYSPAKSVGFTPEDRLDEIVAFSQPENYQNGDVFEIYVRDLGFEIGRTFNYDVDTIANVWHLNGTSITFNSGLLGGQEFELAATNDNTTRVERLDKEHLFYSIGARYVIRLKYKIEDDTNYRIPNEQIFAKGGDSFVITGMDMPLLYHYWAENKLLEKAKEYLKENSTIEHKYAIEFDNLKLAMHPTIAMQICEGNALNVVDNDLDTKRIEEDNLIKDNGTNSLGSLGYINSYGRFNTNKNVAIKKDLVIAYLDNGDYTFLAKEVKTNNPISLKLISDTTNVLDTIFNENKYENTFNVNSLKSTTTEFKGASEFDIRTSRLSIEDGIRTFYDDKGIGILWRDILVDYNENPLGYYLIKGVNKNGLTDKFATLFTKTNEFYNQNYAIDKKITAANGYFENISFDVTIPISKYYVRRWLHEDIEKNGKTPLPFYLVARYRNNENTTLIQKCSLKTNDFELEYDINTGKEIYDFTTKVTIDKLNVSSNVELFLILEYSAYSEKDAEDYEYHYSECAVFPKIEFARGNEQKIVVTELAQFIVSNDSYQEQELEINEGVLVEGILNYDKYNDSCTIDIENCTIKVECADDFSPNADKKTFSATLSNKTAVSGWQIVKSEIKNNNNNITEAKKDIDTLIQTSRNTQESLDILKENIFDPDGNIQNTFLSTLLLQVGADSMNYYLKLTRVTVWGEMNNIEYNSNDDIITFGKDILYHYEYKCGGEQGTWSIEQPATFDLKNGGEYWSADANGDKVFFVAICCNKNNLTDAFWIVSDNIDMLKVENDMFPNYYVFNYAIISAMEKDENGTIIKQRMITETRGKSYMYGDNIITGKISSMNGMTWINLVDGSFNFGDKLVLDGDGNLINNGMILTNRLEVKDEKSDKEDKTVAGVNGILDQEDRLESPAFWAGGTYEEAINGETHTMINHKGLGRIGVVKYFAEWILIKSKGFFNTIISSIKIEDTLKGVSKEVGQGIVFEPRLSGIQKPSLLKSLTNRPVQSVKPATWSGEFDSIWFRENEEAPTTKDIVTELVYLDLDYTAPEQEYYVYFDEPIEYVIASLNDFSLEINGVVDNIEQTNIPYYFLKYKLGFEIYLDNGYGLTRIASLKQKESTYLFQKTEKPSRVYDINDYLRIDDWSGFQFNGKEGNKDSFLLIEGGKKVKIVIRAIIDYAKHGFSSVSFFHDRTPYITLKWMGTMRYRIRECATVLASDGICMKVGDTEPFSIKHFNSGGIDSLKWEFVGKVRQSSTVFREGKLQSLPNGVLVLNNGDYEDGDTEQEGVKYRTPMTLILEDSKFEELLKTEKTNPTINEYTYTGTYVHLDLKDYVPYNNAVVLSVNQKDRIRPELVNPTGTGSDWWVQGKGKENDVIYINKDIEKVGDIHLIVIC
jgi:hypothetical protein